MVRSRSTRQALTGPSKPLSCAGVDRLVFERLAGQPPRGGGDHHGVRRGGRLQARGEVRRLADDVALLRLAGADQFADHDQAGGDADADLMRAADRRARATASIKRERGAHGVLGVGLVRLRIAEIDQHAVAHVFGDDSRRSGATTSAAHLW